MSEKEIHAITAALDQGHRVQLKKLKDDQNPDRISERTKSYIMHPLRNRAQGRTKRGQFARELAGWPFSFCEVIPCLPTTGTASPPI